VTVRRIAEVEVLQSSIDGSYRAVIRPRVGRIVLVAGFSTYEALCAELARELCKGSVDEVSDE